MLPGSTSPFIFFTYLCSSSYFCASASDCIHIRWFLNSCASDFWISKFSCILRYISIWFFPWISRTSLSLASSSRLIISSKRKNTKKFIITSPSPTPHRTCSSPISFSSWNVVRIAESMMTVITGNSTYLSHSSLYIIWFLCPRNIRLIKRIVTKQKNRLITIRALPITSCVASMLSISGITISTKISARYSITPSIPWKSNEHTAAFLYGTPWTSVMILTMRRNITICFIKIISQNSLADIKNKALISNTAMIFLWKRRLPVSFLFWNTSKNIWQQTASSTIMAKSINR